MRPFTSRELDILKALPVGLSNQGVADLCNMSVSTVKAHLADIFVKTQTESRMELLVWGIQHGYITIQPL